MRSVVAMSTNVIRVQGVRKHFKTYDIKGTGFFSSLFRRYYTKNALSGVSFDVKEGEIVALLGKNGSGKSTLIKIITGILYPDGGSVSVLDKDPWKKRREVATQIGVVLGAHGQLFWDLPAMDTFTLMKHVYGIPDRRFKERLDYFLERLELQKVYKRQVRTLSLGEQMKCNFVASMLHSPRIVFLDEPTIGVDLSSKAALRETVNEVTKREHTTFFMTTHITEDIDMAERVIMLDKGRKIYDGPRRKLVKLFGDKREVELRFREPVNVRKYASFGRILESQSNYVKLEIQGKILKSGKLIQTLSDPNLVDYSVAEPGLAEVILKLYNKQDKRGRK